MQQVHMSATASPKDDHEKVQIEWRPYKNYNIYIQRKNNNKCENNNIKSTLQVREIQKIINT